MPFQLPEQWKRCSARLLKALNEKEVKYLVIGSLAKTLHNPCLPQARDTDILIGRSSQNAAAAQQAILQIFPGASHEIYRLGKGNKLQQMQLPPPGNYSVIKEVDILTVQQEKFDFHKAWQRSTRIEIPNCGIQVQIASTNDLARLDKLRAKAKADEETIT